MSRRVHGNRRWIGSDGVVQPLEGRLLLSSVSGLLSSLTGGSTTPTPTSTAPVRQNTATSLQASTQTSAIQPPVDLTATVVATAADRPVDGGRVRFSVISPTPELLGVAHPDSRGSATLRTTRLTRGETYVIQASYIAPNASYYPSNVQLDVTIGESPAKRFVIRAPQYFGAPGFPITFSVTALNRAGQPATDYMGTVQFYSSTDHSAKLPQRTYTFSTADEGTHDFPDGVTFHKGGAEVLKVRQVNNTQISGSQAFGIE